MNRYGLNVMLVGTVMCSLYASEEYTAVVTQEIPLQLKVVEVNEPHIALGTCAYCGNELRIPVECSRCNGAEYCSKNCQEQDTETHKPTCAKLHTAQKGNITQLENLLRANIAACKKTKNSRYFRKAREKHYKILIRIAQDEACSLDASTAQASMKATAEHMEFFDGLIKNGIIKESDISFEEHQTMHYDAIAWARRLVEDETVVSPVGILVYGNYYLNETRAALDTMLTEEQYWKEDRLNATNIYKASLLPEVR